jgi:hypothetical protein
MTDASTRPRAVLNTKEFGSLASTLLEGLRKQKEQIAATVGDLTEQADKLFEAATKVGRSHSGSNFGYHGALYYKDFEAPSLGAMFNVEWGGVNGIPPGWTMRGPEEVKLRIEKIAAVTFTATEEAIKAPLNAAKEMHKEILIRLAPLHQLPDGNRERQLLDSLEHLDWQDSAHNEYAGHAMKTFPNMTRDSGAFTQGIVLPAHAYYEAAAIQVKRSCKAIEGFWNSAERLLRQLQLAATQALVTVSEPEGDASIATKYARLKMLVGFLAALVLSFAIAGTTGFIIRRFQWKWLLTHPNSYAIQGLSYAVLLLFLVGLLVRRIRKYCWGIALIPLVVDVLQSLGGPPKPP